MHDFDPFELARVDLRGGETGDAAGELSPIEVTDPHHVAGVELAFAPRNARRQEALAVIAQGFPGAGVHHQRSLRMMEEGDPAFAALQTSRLRHEQRAFVLAGENPGEAITLLRLRSTRFRQLLKNYGSFLALLDDAAEKQGGSFILDVQYVIALAEQLAVRLQQGEMQR